MTNGSQKWETARSIGAALKDKLAEVLIVLMFLLSGVYAVERVGGAIVQQMKEVAAALGAIREAIIAQTEISRAESSTRTHEHRNILTKLEECQDMGVALSHCRKRLRDGDVE